ncbi:ATP-binding protein [Duganella sp.]|uniref:hybrid sensor histidine kinase/response regulator n=1 Tax=Duganella sp. TaxID=1904440 RepID=UPI0031D72863
MVPPALNVSKPATAGLLSGVDWLDSPLGPVEAWSPALRAAADLMTHSESAMFLVWGDDRIFLYNRAYLPVLGSKHPRALGRPMIESWAEVWPEVSLLLQRSFAGESLRFENHPFVIRRNGLEERAWFDFSYTPIFAPAGGVEGVLCILSEKTGQVLAERALQQQADMLQQLFAEAPGFMALLRGPQHVFELANASYRELIGGRNPVNQPLREALPEVVEQGFLALLDEVYRTGERYIGRRVPVTLRRDDALAQFWVDFVYQPVYGTDGKVNGIFVQGTDVTHHVHTELALQEAVDSVAAERDRLNESEAKFRVIANAIPHLVWSQLPDGTREFCNDQWYEFTGLAPTATHQDWEALVHAGDRAHAARRWAEAQVRGQAYDIEFRLLHQPSATHRWCLGRVLPVHDAAGRLVRWLGTCTDIHEQRSQTEELRAAANRKDEFLAMLAHELRNPLAPIRAAAELLKIEGADAARQARAVAIIDRQVRHMTELVDDLLDVSRVTRGLVELELLPTDLKAVVSAAVEQARPLIASRGHTLHLHVAADAAVVLGDATRLIQVVVNLLSNAAKYTPRGGRIDVSVAVPDTQVRIVVSDNGSGIGPELLPHVFEMFTQAVRTPDRSEGGLGIGLTLVRSLVEAHGGSVSADSDGVGKGSRFTLCLPAHHQQPPAPRVAAGELTRSASGRRVLLVDDNVDAAETLGELLAVLGHEVRLSFDGQRAIEIAAGFDPDIFILDVGLPDINGYELAHRLRMRPSAGRALFIALTGYGQEHDRVLSRTAGFHHHFVKPLDVGRLSEILEHAPS